MKKILTILAFILVLNFTSFSQTKYNIVGNGIVDDTKALNAWGQGKKVTYKGKVLGRILQNGKFKITWGIKFNRKNSIVRNNTFYWHYTGFDSLNWITYGRRVKHYRNQIVDRGTIDNLNLRLEMYEKILEYKDKILARQQEQLAVAKLVMTLQNQIILQESKRLRKERDRKEVWKLLTKSIM